MVFEIILGIGTLLILGFQVWILWRQTEIINSQKEIAKDQSTYLMRKEDPQIDVQKKEYEEDKLILNLINMGGTKAVGVALKTEVHIVNPEIIKKASQVLVSSHGDWDINKQFNFKDEEKSYSLGSSIIEIYHDKSKYPELELNQNRKFTQEVTFGLYDKKEKFPTPSKTITFKQLIVLLKKNNVLGCEIRLSLLYKNLSNKLVEEQQIDKFYIMPPNLKSKFLSELKEEDRLKGGMRYVPIHPFLKQEFNISKSEETYRSINHCER
ncbi:MAG: hypothetical protein KJ600_04010 [Nanoarchaeota archaeon]|nr:hypothetical protein [Nanoarchaeota archaeon]